MRIEFRKITHTPKLIDVTKSNDIESITLKGELARLDSKLVKFSGTLSGRLNLICVRSGQEFSKEISQDLVLYFADGIYKMQSQSEIDLDVIEFFEGFIDFDFIVNSEIESIRLDYNVKE